MATPDIAILARARRAYEVGRIRHALLRAWPVLPMAAVSALMCGSVGLTAATAAALLVAIVTMRWHGGPAGRAVAPGLAAGAAPLVIPLAVRSSGAWCLGPWCLEACYAACLAGGVAAAAILWAGAALRSDPGHGRPRFLLMAGGVAALAGTMGCMIAGSIGVLSMAAGVTLGAAPLLVLRPAWRG